MHFLHVIYAAEPWTSTTKDGVATIQSLVPLFKNAVTGITAFAGVVIFIVIVIAGFTFLFSGGDAKQLEKAKHSFTYAIIGLVVIVSAYLIINLIEMFTQVPVTKFNLNLGN
ncbi:hypothetical protein MUP56_02940 [Patescibacteria group bacterium]|nr:hypothetical protein [Patescibacteria group bacterium]